MDYRPIPAIFVADAPGLDFLNSIATPVDEPVDWIGDGEGLLSWLEQAGLVPVDVLSHMRSQATSEELDEIAAKARGLREWFRAFVQKRKGAPLTAKDLSALEPLNQVLQRNEQHGVIVADANAASGLAFGTRRRWPNAES